MLYILKIKRLSISFIVFLLVLFIISYFGSIGKKQNEKNTTILYYSDSIPINVDKLYRNNYQKVEGSKSYYNIFFAETSSTRKYFNMRQMCAIESAALNNPNAKVIVYSKHAKMRSVWLEQYPNIFVLKLNYNDIIKNTLLENWFISSYEEIGKSPYFLTHMSDLLRYVILWKYGGYYSDLDTITIKSDYYYYYFFLLLLLLLLL